MQVCEAKQRLQPGVDVCTTDIRLPHKVAPRSISDRSFRQNTSVYIYICIYIPKIIKSEHFEQLFTLLVVRPKIQIIVIAIRTVSIRQNRKINFRRGGMGNGGAPTRLPHKLAPHLSWPSPYSNFVDLRSLKQGHHVFSRGQLTIFSINLPKITMGSP
jgi:hypothetical protein